MSVCTKCGTFKPVEDFSRVRKEDETRRACCKVCCKQRTKSWRRKNPRKAIDHSLKWQSQNKEQQKLASQKYLLKKKFNLSLEEYNTKLQEQNHSCAICHKMCSSGRKLAVDHNHETRQNRGLFCTNCNLAIGHMQEDIDLLKNAIEYIQYYENNK
jgi:hypothetical protein